METAPTSGTTSSATSGTVGGTTSSAATPRVRTTPNRHATDASEPPLTDSDKRHSGLSFHHRRQRLLLGVGGVVLVVWALAVAWQPIRVADTELDFERGRTVTRRRPELLTKVQADGTVRANTPLDGILEGHWTLIDIHLPKEWFRTGNPQLIQATFCHIAWDLQTRHPYPLFADLQRASVLCPSTKLTVQLVDIVAQAQAYDATLTVSIAHAPTVFVWAQPKSGSTVVSNALAAFRSTRVYAEAAPLTTALQTCTKSTTPSCTALIQDVLYVMGRMGRSALATTMESTQRIVYKLDSRHVQFLPWLGQAMPTTPWIFMYRNAADVLANQFRPTASKEDVKPDCVQGYSLRTDLEAIRVNGTYSHEATLVALATSTQRPLLSWTKEEYCAAYLAASSTAAISYHQATPYVHHVVALQADTDVTESSTVPTSWPPRWFVNYNQLPFVVWETLLPRLLVGEADQSISASDVQAMQDATRRHSHATTSTTRYKDTSPPVSTALQQAAQLFLEPVYVQLEGIRMSSGEEEADHDNDPEN